MALYRLTSPEMIQLSATMVDIGHRDHVALMSQPDLAGLMPGLATAHRALVVATQGLLNAQLSPVLAAQSEIADRRYWLARAIQCGLQLYIALALARGDEAQADRLQDLSRAMFPDGLLVIDDKYERAVQRARQVGELLTEEVENNLRQLALQGGNLLALVRSWIDMTETLGTLERQRVAFFLNQRQSGDMTRARATWNRLISVLRSIVSTVQIDDPEVVAIMERITRAERAAGRRALMAENGHSRADAPSERTSLAS